MNREKDKEYENQSESDEKYQQKVTTPKKQGKYGDIGTSKRKRKSHKISKHPTSTSQKAIATNDNLEQKLNRKAKEFKVISKTLKSYFKDETKNSKDLKKNLEFGLKLIKAFNQSHIEEVSPGAKSLIDDIVDSLNKLSTKKIAEQPEKKREESKKHQREESFLQHMGVDRMKYRNYLVSEIDMLSNNLYELKQQAKSLQRIQEDTEEFKNPFDKQAYIGQLQEIVEYQKKVLEELSEEQQI